MVATALLRMIVLVPPNGPEKTVVYPFVNKPVTTVAYVWLQIHVHALRSGSIMTALFQCAHKVLCHIPYISGIRLSRV
jgi:hypothetical protein